MMHVVMVIEERKQKIQWRHVGDEGIAASSIAVQRS